MVAPYRPSALNLTAHDVATAAGCGVDLVERIESGDHDPVLDTLERLVNGIGLELRCGAADTGVSDPNPAYRRVDSGEVARLANGLRQGGGLARSIGDGSTRPPGRNPTRLGR